MNAWLWMSLTLLLVLLPPAPGRFTTAAPSPETAALQVVQKTLRARGSGFNGNRADAPFCTNLLGDVMAGQNIDPIAPIFETTSGSDPRLQRLACQLPHEARGPRSIDGPDWRYLERRWRYVPDSTRRWQPPFSLYEIALDGASTASAETVLFHGGRPADRTTPARPTAYTWMNRRACSIESEVPVGWHSRAVPDLASPVETHLLVRTQGAIVVLDLLASPPGTRPEWMSFDATRLERGAPQHCAWSWVSGAPPGTAGAEAKKLHSIVQAVRAGGDRSVDRRPTEPFCRGFLRDLQAGAAVDAVEPTFETLDFQDPRILKLTCPFDVEDNPQVHRSGDPGLHVRSPRELGHAPYRLYHAELDGNPLNGSETVLYHTYAGGAGRSTGYSWVDFPRCWRKRFWATSTSRAVREDSMTDLLVRYRGQILVLNLVTDVTGGERIQLSLSTSPFASDQPGLCSWTFERSGQRPGGR